MNCRRAASLLTRAGLEPLAPHVAEALERHLAACSRCQADQRSLAQVLALLDSTRPAAEMPDMWAAIEARLTSPRPVARRWPLVLAPAAVGLLLVAGAVLLRPEPPRVAFDDSGFVAEHLALAGGVTLADAALSDLLVLPTHMEGLP